MSTTLTLAIVGLILAVSGTAGAAWSLWRLPGTTAGATLSAVCGALSVCGLALSVAAILRIWT
jgi:hypothetical protein